MSEKTFKESLTEIVKKWQIQKDKATKAAALMEEADKLMCECEDIETEMVADLNKAKELDPEAYEEFLKSFGEER